MLMTTKIQKCNFNLEIIVRLLKQSHIVQQLSSFTMPHSKVITTTNSNWIVNTVSTNWTYEIKCEIIYSCSGV